MKKLLLGTAALLLTANAAQAVTVQLESRSAVAGGIQYNYGGTLATTEGVTNGSRFVIFDFAGYVANSVFSPYANVIASVEPTSTAILPPGAVDSPALVNLVFTYVGPDLQTTPDTNPPSYTAINFDGLSAVSIFGGTLGQSAFSGETVKNTNTTTLYSQGYLASPLAAVPEASTWAMMISGIGMTGYAMRRRRGKTVSAAA